MILYQKPNKSIILTFIFGLLAFFTSGSIHFTCVILTAIFGSYWSYQEAFNGVNWFRQLLGIIGFLLVAHYLYTNFH